MEYLDYYSKKRNSIPKNGILFQKTEYYSKKRNIIDIVKSQ